MDRRISFTKARKRSTGRISAEGLPPATSSNRIWSRNSETSARTSEAQSRLNAPGITRRSGRTAKSVSAMVNWASGLRAGARKACIQKRTRAASTKRLPSASMTNASACETISGLPPERLAQLARALARRLDGLDEVPLDLRGLEHLHGRLGRAALGGHLGAQDLRILAALDRKLGRAHEG